jgi:hypothetical protein
LFNLQYYHDNILDGFKPPAIISRNLAPVTTCCSLDVISHVKKICSRSHRQTPRLVAMSCTMQGNRRNLRGRWILVCAMLVASLFGSMTAAFCGGCLD